MPVNKYTYIWHLNLLLLLLLLLLLFHFTVISSAFHFLQCFQFGVAYLFIFPDLNMLFRAFSLSLSLSFYLSLSHNQPVQCNNNHSSSDSVSSNCTKFSLRLPFFFSPCIDSLHFFSTYTLFNTAVRRPSSTTNNDNNNSNGKVRISLQNRAEKCDSKEV